MTSLISACICTYNRYDLLEQCIESLTRQTLEASKFSILIMDNSPDAEKAMVEKKKYADIDNLRYEHLDTPGLSNARNVGAEICGTELIAYIDDDAIASENWLKSIVDAFESFENSEMVGGPIKPIWSIPKPSWIPKWREGFLTIIDWGAGPPRPINENEWFAGANMSFRTNIIKSYGGFPTSLGRIGGASSLLSNEEINLVDEIKKNHGQIIYAPQATVDHLVDESRLKRDWFKKRVSWQVVSDILMTSSPWLEDECWNRIELYYEMLPPYHRNLNAFSLEHDDPNVFHLQLEALEAFLHLSLSGFGGKVRNDF